MDRVKRIWYLSHMRAAKVQASLRIRAVSPEPPLLAHTSIESRGTFRQKTRSLAPLNGWACAVKICHDGMLEDTKSLDAAQMIESSLWAIKFSRKKKRNNFRLHNVVWASALWISYIISVRGAKSAPVIRFRGFCPVMPFHRTADGRES